MIIIRPLIKVLSKIIELPKGSYLDPTTLGSGDPDGTNFLRGDGTWSTPTADGYVPYVGATEDVDLGEWELKAGQIELDQSPTGTAGVAVTRWNNSAGVTETTLKGGSVILKNGVDLVARVVNKVTPNTTLTKAAYQAVRISGAQGQRLAVAYAQANTDNNSADTIGIVAETIATNQEGFIITVGQLEDINTTGSLQGETWGDGDVLYLSPTTAGMLTNIKPTGLTGHIVVMGYVEYAHSIHGKIYVKIMNGWELDELHNVYINPATLADNDILQYDSASSLWKNEALSTGITVGTTAVTSGTIGRVFFQGTGNVVQQDASFLFDGTNKTLTNYGKGAVTSNTSFGIGVFQNGTGAGTQNTAIGYYAGNYLTTGTSNTMVGYRAGGGILASNFTGNNNTLIGADSGLYLSSGIQNTFIGSSTGVSVTTGSRNTIIGQYTASLSPTLAQNVIISDGASQVALWMNGSQRVGFGFNPLTDSLGAKVDIKAKGALSTDIAFRVRNSADSADLASIQGNGVLNLAYLADSSRIAINSTTSGQAAIAIGSGDSGLRTVSVGYNNVANGQNGVVIGQGNTAAAAGNCGIIVGYNNNHTSGAVVGKSNTGQLSLIFGNENAIGGAGPTNNGVIAIGNRMTETSGNAKMPHTFMFGSYASGTANKAGLSFRSNNINHLLLGYDIMNASYSSTNGTNWFGIANGTAPDGAIDAFQLYSADIVAGNAAPHFRTEAGDIIKLYKQSSAGITTVADLVTVLTNLGLLA